MKFASICSDARKGNCYILHIQDFYYILDIGCTRTQLYAAIEKNHIDVDKVKAVFLTHHHETHTKGLKFLLGLNPFIPIYSMAVTFDLLKYQGEFNSQNIQPRKTFKLDEVTIYPFRVRHTAPTCNYIIEYKEQRFAYITNTGNIDKTLIDDVGKCEHFLIESYYHPGIARKNGKWEELKRMVTAEGHLSNEDATEIIARCASPDLKNVFLSNLSQHNNRNLAYLTTLSMFEEEEMVNVKLLPNNEVSDWIELNPKNEFLDLVQTLSIEEQQNMFQKLKKL